MWKQIEEGFWAKNRESKVGDVSDIVSDIIDRVREEGDRALFDLTRKFDKLDLDSLAVGRDKIDEAYEDVDPVLVEELEEAAYNIQRFHELQLPKDLWLTEMQPGVTLGVKSTPLRGWDATYPAGRPRTPAPCSCAPYPQGSPEWTRSSAARPAR